MSSINKKNTSAAMKQAGLRNGSLGVSMNGNIQAKNDVLYSFYQLVVGSLYGKDTYYETSDNRFKRMQEAIRNCVAVDALDFVANTILHARIDMNIRTMPILATVSFAKALRESGKQYEHLRTLTRDVIRRADQITDMIAAGLMVFGSKQNLPMAIRRGIADAFNKFDEYQFSKYNGSNSVKMRDALRIVHPKSKDEAQGMIFKKIMEDNLQTAYTWETELSAAGESGKSKAQVWAELINSGKLGYMALLRNLRNIEENIGDAELIRKVANTIKDPENVARSKQLPYAFVNAYQNVQNNTLKRAVSQALDLSVNNVPELGKGVWLLIDTSGSMGSYYGFYGNRQSNQLTAAEHSMLLAAILLKANADADNIAVTLFDGSARMLPSVNVDDSVLTIRDKLMKHFTGGSTNLAAGLAMKKQLKFEPDTVVVLSDMEVDSYSMGLPHDMGAGLFKADTIKVAVDLNNASGTTPLSKSGGWIQLSGFSEKMFQFIPAARDGHNMTNTLAQPFVSR